MTTPKTAVRFIIKNATTGYYLTQRMVTGESDDRAACWLPEHFQRAKSLARQFGWGWIVVRKTLQVPA